MPRRSTPTTLFGRRLRAARSRAGLAQDKLGVIIGMDEGSSSARISRYETGVHEPPFDTAARLAFALRLPVAYFYCDDEQLADFLIHYAALDAGQQLQLLSLAAQLHSAGQ